MKKKGHVTKRTNAYGTYYMARITIGWDGEKQKYKYGKSCSSRQEAEQDLQRLLKLKESNSLGGNQGQTLNQYILGFETIQEYQTALALFNQKKLKASDLPNSWLKKVLFSRKWNTYNTYSSDLIRHILPVLGGMSIFELRPKIIQKCIDDLYIGQMAKGFKGGSCTRRSLAALKTALEEIVDPFDDEYLPRNPCFKVKAPMDVTDEPELWNDEQARVFLETAKDSPIFPHVYLAITSGLRQGELLGLMWSDLLVYEKDGGQVVGQVFVRRTLVRVATHKIGQAHLNPQSQHLHGNYFTNTPKTQKSKAPVSLPPDTIAVLTNHFQAQKEHKEMMSRKRKRYEDLSLMFPDTSGLPMSKRSLTWEFEKLIASSGVPKIKWHDLRDTHATRLLALGVDLATVSQRLRHSVKSTTLNKYVHVIASMAESGTVSMDKLFSLDIDEVKRLR